MRGLLNVLIAVTCVAVLAAVGYYFWSEYREGERREAVEAAQRASGLRVMCRQMLDDVRVGRSADWKVGHVVTCVSEGYLREDQFNTVELAAALGKARRLIDDARKAKP